ncbi:DNA/RNA non-specific endonuclease [Rhodococcus pyridinivorans]|uniref:DNA/RNA non-specific endonuclease n=1 Tax=Rhodococcus pyridinivorans TaxID=103816 RepID=UPI0036AA6978
MKPDIAKANDGSEVLHYTHFSLAMRKSRRFAAWVAWNIDGGSRKKLSRKNIDFVNDPRLAADAQAGNELYGANGLDRGHLARRADLLSGSTSEATKANRDSFFYTNITPQMDDFNQSARDGAWGKLEDAVFADVEVDDLKVSAFGGPVFADDDRDFRRVKIPRKFWKVLVFMENGELEARGFLLSQNLDQLEVLDLDEFRVFQVPLAEIEQRARLRFPQALRDADLQVATEAITEPLDSVAAIHW